MWRDRQGEGYKQGDHCKGDELFFSSHSPSAPWEKDGGIQSERQRVWIGGRQWEALLPQGCLTHSLVMRAGLGRSGTLSGSAQWA